MGVNPTSSYSGTSSAAQNRVYNRYLEDFTRSSHEPGGDVLTSPVGVNHHVVDVRMPLPIGDRSCKANEGVTTPGPDGWALVHDVPKPLLGPLRPPSDGCVQGQSVRTWDGMIGMALNDNLCLLYTSHRGCSTAPRPRPHQHVLSTLASLPASVSSPANLFGQTGRYVAPSFRWRIHRFRL